MDTALKNYYHAKSFMAKLQVNCVLIILEVMIKGGTFFPNNI